MHCRYGLECLFRFFSYGLEAKFRPELYKDFQTETLKDCQVGQLYGLEKFWAFTKYYKHAEELHIQPQLKDKLEPFKSIEDFKVLYKVIKSLKKFVKMKIVSRIILSCIFQEEDKGKRSRNPSFSNNAQHPGNKGRRSRTASEGDQVVQTNNSYQGRHSTGGSKPSRGRANSGGSKPVRVNQSGSQNNQKRTKSNSECSAASIEK